MNVSDTAYSNDELLGGVLTCYVEDDGLTFRGHYESELGSFESRVRWDDLKTALDNYHNAYQSLLSKVPAVVKRLEELEKSQGSATDYSRMKTLVKTSRGELTFYKNSGPPIWLLPRVGLARWSIKVGWLYTCYMVYWSK